MLLHIDSFGLRGMDAYSLGHPRIALHVDKKSQQSCACMLSCSLSLLLVDFSHAVTSYMFEHTSVIVWSGTGTSP